MEEMHDVFFENGMSVQLNGSSLYGDDCDDDSEHYKKYFLDADLFFDEISDRISVSRMVNNSVIKGIVNAISEEANDTIFAKDTEIANLRNELKHCESELLNTKYFLPGKSTENVSLEAFMISGNGTSNGSEKLFSLRNVDRDTNDALVQCGSIEADVQLKKVMKEVEDIRILVSSVLAGNCFFNSGSVNNELISTSNSSRTSFTETKMHSDYNVNVSSELNKISRNVVKMEEELRSLNDIFCSCLFLSQTTLLESQWMFEIQEAVSGIVLQGFIENIQQHYVEELSEQQVICAQHDVWLSQQNVISNLREELGNISRYLFDSDLGHPLLHGSHEDHNQVANGRKRVQRKVFEDHLLPGHQEQNSSLNSSSNGVSIEISDYSHMKHLSKDELINYFRNEMIKMSRNHESQLHASTEECFRLKRELLKDKRSVPICKDKDFNGLNKRMINVISEIDHIIKHNSRSSFIFDDNRKIRGMMNQMIKENENMKNMLTVKKKEIWSLATKLADANEKVSRQHSAELNLLRQIRKFKSDMEDGELELLLRDEIYKVVLKEFMLGHHCEINDSDLEIIAMHEFCNCVLNASLKDADVIIKSTMEKYSEEKQCRSYLESLAEEREQSLCSEIIKNEHLKGKIVSLSVMLEEKEQFESEAKFNLVRQKEELEVALQERNKFMLQTLQQGRQITDMTSELETVCGLRDSALQQVDKFSIDLKVLQKRLDVALNSLNEVHKQKGNLENILKEKECLVSVLLQKEKEQKVQWEIVSRCVSDRLKEILEFEQRISSMISLKNVRFQMLHAALHPLIQHGGRLKRRGLWYRKILSDLQTAEHEVDLLGDKVDGLLSLLEKIYFALDHYSPVLKHYPGIMEIKKLVRRELSGEKSSGQSSSVVSQHGTP